MGSPSLFKYFFIICSKSSWSKSVSVSYNEPSKLILYLEYMIAADISMKAIMMSRTIIIYINIINLISYY